MLMGPKQPEITTRKISLCIARTCLRKLHFRDKQRTLWVQLPAMPYNTLPQTVQPDPGLTPYESLENGIFAPLELSGVSFRLHNRPLYDLIGAIL